MSDNVERGVVLYTDGSSRPSSRGFTGWGVHGYLFRYEAPKTGAGLTGYVVTNKGYFKGQVAKDNPDGLLAVSVESYFDMHGADSDTDTNNGAEIDAMYYALIGVDDLKLKDIQVYTDSEYLRKGLTEYVDAWEERGWVKPNGQPIPNAKQWKRLLATVKSWQTRGTDVRIAWVRGHDGNIGNTIADVLAGIASVHAYYGRPLHDLSRTEAKGYWKHDPERHPLLAFKRVYFNASPEYDKDRIYYTANPGHGVEEHVFGNRTPESSYCILKIPGGIPAIDRVKAIHHEDSDGINAILRIDVDNVYHRFTHDHLMKYGRLCMGPQTNLYNRGMSYVNSDTITEELNQGGLTLRAIHCFGILEELLGYYELMKAGKNELVPSQTLLLHDITNLFYEKDVKGKTVLKTEYKVGFTDMTLDVTIDHHGKPYPLHIPFVIGKDVLPRNHLKRIENLSPTISLLTWKASELSIRYACVVHVGDDISIWSNYYADCIYLPE